MDSTTFMGQGIFFHARARIVRSATLAFLIAFVSTTLFAANEKTFQNSLQKISSTDLGTSLQAIDYLGRAKDPRAVPALSSAYPREKRMVIQRAIVDALGLLRMPEAAPTLQLALNHPDPQVRQSAVVAFEMIGVNPQALIDHTAKENDAAVKANMIQVLGRSKNPKSAGALKIFSKDKNNQISRMAQRELDKKATPK